MSATKTDYQIASLAAGFTLGFGFLTVWEASKQTIQNKSPLRSAYIYMLWGEIVVNLVIGIIGWLFLDGIVGPTVPVLFFIIFLWVFEVQLLMQIIINRIAIIAENKKTVKIIKWGTAFFITLINILVFCIWIPAHTSPPASELFVSVNKYWDRTSKVLILFVDAGLNYYFLHTVKKRLVEQHKLVKYAPLVSFNAKLMVVSIAMDGMLLGLMSLPNEVVYIQFHPVAYLVKLNIEMSMASLITRLATSSNTATDANIGSLSYSRGNEGIARNNPDGHSHDLKSFTRTKIQSSPDDIDASQRRVNGIHRMVDFEVTVHDASPGTGAGSPSFDSNSNSHIARVDSLEDEESLTRYPGHPR